MRLLAVALLIAAPASAQEAFATHKNCIAHLDTAYQLQAALDAHVITTKRSAHVVFNDVPGIESTGNELRDDMKAYVAKVADACEAIR